jgi:hypothetical protein
MEKITIDEYNAKCTMILNGVNKEIFFCRNDYDITFIYLDDELISVFVPENAHDDIKSDIRRLYDNTPIIIFGYLDEISFSYGMVIGMINWDKICEGVVNLDHQR